MAAKLEIETVRRAVDAAVREDLGERGDITTDAMFSEARPASARLVAREPLVLAGILVAREVFRVVDDSLEFRTSSEDGARLTRGETAATLKGDLRAMLRGERTALNFLMRMSGIATAAWSAVEEVAPTRARILDTRKTAPGLRVLDKYAVACGGAVNHRMGLFDEVMIKDTHLGSGCGVTSAVRRALDAGHPPERITVEVRTLDELRDAVAAGAGRALLDNMDIDTLARAVETAGGRIALEASGGLRPGTLREVARTGVDFLSLGWLTHSAPAADLAMEVDPLR